ncbi:hypothetical protein ACP4OV_018389 [Aristida adscensionis]
MGSTSHSPYNPPIRVRRAPAAMASAPAAPAAESRREEETEAPTRVGDLPEACLALAIARTSPRDACRCAAVSPAFRAAADSDLVWERLLPGDLQLQLQSPPPPSAKQAAAAAGNGKKGAYLALCDAGGALVVDGGGCRVWLEKASGARCYALPARRLSLPWDDGEFAWAWTPHPLSRFAEVAELVDCTSLDIYGSLPAAALTPATTYAAHLVYGTAEGHRGLSYPDQETAVAVARHHGGSYPDQETAVAVGSSRGGAAVVARHAVCLRPDEAEARKFWAVAAAARGSGGEVAAGADGDRRPRRRPRRREDGWWEIEMGRFVTAAGGDGEEEEEVTASFEVLGWYPKRGLIVDAVEFRPV